MGIRETINRYDGHIYYVIDSEGIQRVVMGVSFLDFYDQLDDVKGQPGIWFVRDAANTKTGQHGDPTVHEGWAMYTWDPWVAADRGGWRKIAEQESVDGPWGIDEKILNMLVKKVEFNAAMLVINNRLTVIEGSLQDYEARINTLEIQVGELNRLKHWHENKAVLDALDNKFGQLVFNDTPVSGNCFFYDNIQNGSIVWKNPTDPEAEPVALASSYQLAKLFCATTMAWHGMTLEVAEVDGSISKYDIVQDPSDPGIYHELLGEHQIKSNRRYWKYFNETYTELTAEEAKDLLLNPEPDTTPYFTEGKLTPVCVSTTVRNAWGGIIYVPTLPADSLANDGRGMWCPTEDDGVHVPFKIYRSVNGIWVDIEVGGGSGSEIPYEGATFFLTYCEDDPIMPRKLVHFYWKEPTDRVSAGKHIRWGATYLVKKPFSAPSSIDDGEIVRKITDRTVGDNGIVAIDSYSSVPMYYRLFSETTAGAKYTPTAAVVPLNLEWTDVFKAVEDGYATKVFSIGDNITMPEHPKFGAIDCEVIGINSDGIMVATQDALISTPFGTNNTYATSTLKTWLDANFTNYTKFKESEERVALEGKKYYVFENGYQELTIAVGDKMPEGVIVYCEQEGELSKGVITKFEIPDCYETPGYEAITKTKRLPHLKSSIDWWTRTPTIGGNVVTGNNINGTAPTTSLGAVVVFTIARPS